MNNEWYFRHKVLEKLFYVFLEHEKEKADRDFVLIDSCRQQQSEYFDLVLNDNSRILPRRVPRDLMVEARERAEFDWYDSNKFHDYYGWIRDTLFPQKEEETKT